ncbi:hypothetical protein HanPSC8_Chr09g0393781 [Helianthus annuus]|nr:hypothetical protein HanPSC8_Chr09g0393781 [Helianthus annuus]
MATLRNLARYFQVRRICSRRSQPPEPAYQLKMTESPLNDGSKYNSVYKSSHILETAHQLERKMAESPHGRYNLVDKREQFVQCDSIF